MSFSSVSFASPGENSFPSMRFGVRRARGFSRAGAEDAEDAEELPKRVCYFMICKSNGLNLMSCACRRVR